MKRYEVYLPEFSDLTEDELNVLRLWSVESLSWVDYVQKSTRDAVYKERNLLVAFCLVLAKMNGFRVERSLHSSEAPDWEEEWQNFVCVYIPTSSGERQLTWHFHQSELNLIDWIPLVKNNFDGHTTQQKYSYIEDFIDCFIHQI